MWFYYCLQFSRYRHVVSIEASSWDDDDVGDISNQESEDSSGRTPAEVHCAINNMVIPVLEHHLQCFCFKFNCEFNVITLNGVY